MSGQGSDRYDVLVIGSGPAGAAAGLRAAELGARTVVVEAERIDGMCVNTGCVPTRVLAKAARTVRDIQDAATYCAAVGEPSVTWDRLVARVRAVIEQVQATKNTVQTLEAAGATVLVEGRAWFLDPHTVQLAGSGRKLRSDAIIVCSGGRSRKLSIPGGDLALAAEDVADLERLPARVAIVGSGSTGSQLATIFNAFGSEVSLLEIQPRILPGVDVDVAGVVEGSFRSQGVNVQTGIERVDRIDEVAPGQLRLAYRRGGDGTQLDVDAVVLSVGWPARTDDLALESAGVRVGPSTIPANEYLQTNVPHIYVAGDADGEAMLVQAAEIEGVAAATNAVLGPTRTVKHALLPFGGFTDPDYAGVGLTEGDARQRDRECLVASVPYAESERAIIDDRTIGFLKLICDRRRSLLLGAHAVGEQAVEIIQAVTTAMAAGADVATLARVEFAYPTYSAIIGQAAERLMSRSADDRHSVENPFGE
jgi:pyruvate/2-oxoglutarate dehydrogenase complex dihydrolipoamide dehydrogenase (E3) component